MAAARAQGPFALRWLRRARAFGRRPLFEQAWMAPAWLLLGVCRAAVLALPFRRLAPRLGEAHGVHAWVPLASAAQSERARRIGRAIRSAARHTPWDSNCLAQACAARVLLSVYGVPHGVYMGVGNDAGAMVAHAWVCSGPVAVTGGHGFGRYTVVGCYASPARAHA